ncbi:MAG: hypothetical protein KDD35_00595 [Bdellovibrionales bacterium]|nr:hypothetical protein [Bdellovibrionales bacterium]
MSPLIAERREESMKHVKKLNPKTDSQSKTEAKAKAEKVGQLIVQGPNPGCVPLGT